MSAELLATTEKLDAVVSGFSSQLEEYIGKMREELTSIANSVSVLGNGWQDSNYQAFITEIPYPLAGLAQRTVRFEKVVKRDEMAKAVLDYLGL